MKEPLSDLADRIEEAITYFNDNVSKNELNANFEAIEYNKKCRKVFTRNTKRLRCRLSSNEREAIRKAQYKIRAIMAKSIKDAKTVKQNADNEFFAFVSEKFQVKVSTLKKVMQWQIF